MKTNYLLKCPVQLNHITFGQKSCFSLVFHPGPGINRTKTGRQSHSKGQKGKWRSRGKKKQLIQSGSAVSHLWFTTDLIGVFSPHTFGGSHRMEALWSRSWSTERGVFFCKWGSNSVFVCVFEWKRERERLMKVTFVRVLWLFWAAGRGGAICWEL